jgi:tRNA(adenine34) deaminase
LLRPSEDEHWMRLALAEAGQAAEQGEVPVGAVVVFASPPSPRSASLLIGRGHNRTESLHDPTAHAEIIAISAAANHLNNWRLTGTTIYVTLEPCLMCTGALMLARVKRIVFGVRDEKFGACGSVYDIPWDNRFNHRLEITSGVLSEECRRLLSRFFTRHRGKA